AVVAMAREKGLMVDPHVSYPMRQTVRDPYAESALKESAIVERFVDDTRALTGYPRRWAYDAMSGAIVHPCILFRAEQRRGLPIFGARDPRRPRPMLTGTEYRSGQKFVHASEGKEGAS